MIKKLVLPLMIGSALLAGDLNLEVSNKTLAGNINLDIPQNENFQVRGTYLYNDHTNKDNYYSVGIAAVGQTPIDNFNSQISIFIDFDHTTDNSAIPIGVSIFNNNIGNYQYPLFAKAEIAYAPDILSFDDADRELKGKFEIGIRPIDNAKAFIGYKAISFNHTYLSVGYAGIGFIF
jgi:hypothetical protein